MHHRVSSWHHSIMRMCCVYVCEYVRRSFILTKIMYHCTIIHTSIVRIGRVQGVQARYKAESKLYAVIARCPACLAPKNPSLAPRANWQM